MTNKQVRPRRKGSYDTAIGIVYVFVDGSVRVYSRTGKPMPQYQGAWAEVKDRLFSVVNPAVPVLKDQRPWDESRK